MVRAVQRINNCSESDALELTRAALPVTVNPGLTEAEALFGQFELICCDAIAAFIRSNVLLEQSDQAYLSRLFATVSQSPEFELTQVDIVKVPTTEAGDRFADQFLGVAAAEDQRRRAGPVSVRVPYKKARIMRHWAERIGAEVRLHATRIRSDLEDARGALNG